MPADAPTTTLTPAAIYALVADSLGAVEERFVAETACSVAAIAAISRELHAAGGKRVRPALALLAGGLVGVSGPGLIALAAVVEMIHAATLIHDDVLDGAATRRGRPSANARWGAKTSVLGGDWLYMQAFKAALRERHFGVLDELIGLTQAMVEGELMQLETLGRVITREQHVALIERKTARLFAAACKLGALGGDLPEEVVGRLGAYGRHLGLAFQMTDDLLDFTASAERLGKPAGGDLREGKMTLPCLYAYERADAEERGVIERVMAPSAGAAPAAADVAAALGIVGARGGIERARSEAAEEAARAREVMLTFPVSPHRDALAELPRLLIERDS